jgi:hypothetical protein
VTRAPGGGPALDASGVAWWCRIVAVGLLPVEFMSGALVLRGAV